MGLFDICKKDDLPKFGLAGNFATPIKLAERNSPGPWVITSICGTRAMGQAGEGVEGGVATGSTATQ